MTGNLFSWIHLNVTEETNGLYNGNGSYKLFTEWSATDAMVYVEVVEYSGSKSCILH